MRKLLLVFLVCIGLVCVAAASPIFTFTDLLSHVAEPSARVFLGAGLLVGAGLLRRELLR